MKRRAFLGLLAGLPLVGALLNVTPVEPVMNTCCWTEDIGIVPVSEWTRIHEACLKAHCMGVEKAFLFSAKVDR